MDRRCIPCKAAKHDECIEVGCSCLTCIANDKDEYVIEYPIYAGGSLVCSLLGASG